ncbi:MAG: aminotransferase DegT [Planctomycetota bacterium]|nr:MAG: aminotransferase DegT [Planctomycetota bacterium]
MTQFVTRAFEEHFGRTFGVPEAIAVNSGTSALIAALWSLDLAPGDEVITTPFTFIATANAIVIAGGRPVFADIDPHTLLIDPDCIGQMITTRTRAIVPVHLFGRVCEIDRIREIARPQDVVVIEDAAQALGACWRGRFAGTLADCGCFSFYKTKNLSTFEGGLLAVPQGSRLNADTLRAIVNQGDTGGKNYEHIGFNFRMPEPSALIGLQTLKLHWPAVVAELGRYGPEDGYYPRLVYEQPAYRRLGLTGQCPVAERVARAVGTPRHEEVPV